MGIKNKNKDPKSTDFGQKDIVINTNEGTLFFKDQKNQLKKLDPNSLGTVNNVTYTVENIVTNEANNLQSKLTQLYLINAQFGPNQTDDFRYLPMNNTTMTIDDNNANFNTYNFITAPYSGKIRKIHFHFRDILGQSHNPGTVTFNMMTTTAAAYQASAPGLHTPTLVDTMFGSGVNCGVVSSFDGFNNTTFSQNDLIAIQVKTSGLDNAFAVGWFQIEIEYDLLLTLNE